MGDRPDHTRTAPIFPGRLDFSSRFGDILKLKRDVGDRETLTTILVFGNSGQVGRELMRSVQNTDKIIGVSRPQVDLLDADSIARAFDESSPTVAINAAAYTAVDKAETERATAFAVNRDGPANLARACAARGIPLIHLSTDYVFDGSKAGPYVEADAVSPISVYGSSKEAGEQALRELLERHVIVRTAWVYSPFGTNFVKSMLRLGAERDELSVVNDQRGCPTSARSIALALLTLAKQLARSPDQGLGTFHFVGGGATNWYDFAIAIFRTAAARGLRTPRIKAITTAQYPTPAKRPFNSILDCHRIGEVYGIKQSSWHSELDKCLDELLSDAKGT